MSSKINKNFIFCAAFIVTLIATFCVQEIFCFKSFCKCLLINYWCLVGVGIVQSIFPTKRISKETFGFNSTVLIVKRNCV